MLAPAVLASGSALGLVLAPVGTVMVMGMVMGWPALALASALGVTVTVTAMGMEMDWPVLALALAVSVTVTEMAWPALVWGLALVVTAMDMEIASVQASQAAVPGLEPGASLV